MMMQLNPPIPLKTPKGRAWAVAMIDQGPQWDLQWVTFVHDTGECWTFRNSQIRQEQNYTFGLPNPSEIGGGKPDISHKEREVPVRDPSATKPQVKEPTDKLNPTPAIKGNDQPSQRQQAMLKAMLDIPMRPFYEKNGKPVSIEANRATNGNGYHYPHSDM